MLEPLKSVLPIIYNMQLDMLNNSRLHNKMNKTLSQVKKPSPRPRPLLLLRPTLLMQCAPIFLSLLLLLNVW